ncbi:arginase [Halovenus marina]|uniref:arginase n=1 Tax=Halovenus marina TaxID=3396621 RepID=UPI003F56CAED
MDRPVHVIGVPMDLGADRRGVDMGPSAIRYGGLADRIEAAGITCRDGGNVRVPRPEQQTADLGETVDGGRAKFLPETKLVSERLADRVASARRKHALPLVLGGDHSIAIGTVGGLDADSLGVLWFDAHGDCNTPATTPSGNVHGMGLAALLGEGSFADLPWARAPAVSAENVAVVGLRDLDPGERDFLADSDVSVYTMSDIDTRGVTSVVSEALSVVTDGVDGLHVSLDLDWLDPDEAPGVGTPVRGGVTYREAHAAMELVHEQSQELSALELVEVNPILDEHNRTAELACELAASALGDRIL